MMIFGTLTRILTEIGGAGMFFYEVMSTGVRKPIFAKDVIDQTFKVTIQSLSTTALAGFFVGALLTVQFTVLVQEFGALGYLGGLATSGTFREIGPLLIAFMLSGKVGAFTAAELGTMKVTEQMDAIRCLGADPIQEIIVPRFFGIIFSSFLLLGLGLIMSIGGGMTLGVIFSGINPTEYIRHIPTLVSLPSILTGLFKCFMFAVMLATICTFKGYTASGGAKGVGQAVVTTAVMTMIGIVLMDYVTSVISETVIQLAMGE